MEMCLNLKYEMNFFSHLNKHIRTFSSKALLNIIILHRIRNYKVKIMYCLHSAHLHMDFMDSDLSSQ